MIKSKQKNYVKFDHVNNENCIQVIVRKNCINDCMSAEPAQFSSVGINGAPVVEHNNIHY